MSVLTKSQQAALEALREAGGSGVIQPNGGRVLAAGQVLRFMPDTWLRLVTLGFIEGDGPNRIRLATSIEPAIEAINKLRRPVRDSLAASARAAMKRD